MRDSWSAPPPEASRLILDPALQNEMVAHCLRSLPYEGCGLILGGITTGLVVHCIPTRNVAESSRLYTVDSRDLLRADRQASDEGLSVIGVFHSHTHTDPYPSPTDIDQAPDPNWHYVLVSLRDELASIRSYRIVEGEVTEEPIDEDE